MVALDENPAVDIQNKGIENRAYSYKSKEKQSVIRKKQSQICF